MKHTIPVLTGSLSGACCSSCLLGRWCTTSLGAELDIFVDFTVVYLYFTRSFRENSYHGSILFSFFCERDEDNKAEFFFPRRSLFAFLLLLLEKILR